MGYRSKPELIPLTTQGGIKMLYQTQDQPPDLGIVSYQTINVPAPMKVFSFEAYG